MYYSGIYFSRSTRNLIQVNQENHHPHRWRDASRGRKAWQIKGEISKTMKHFLIYSMSIYAELNSELKMVKLNHKFEITRIFGHQAFETVKFGSLIIVN